MIELDEELYYESGITAQGCWEQFDTYAIQSIDKLIELVIRQCADVADGSGDPKWTILNYYGLLDD